MVVARQILQAEEQAEDSAVVDKAMGCADEAVVVAEPAGGIIRYMDKEDIRTMQTD